MNTDTSYIILTFAHSTDADSVARFTGLTVEKRDEILQALHDAIPNEGSVYIKALSEGMTSVLVNTKYLIRAVGY